MKLSNPTARSKAVLLITCGGSDLETTCATALTEIFS